MEKEFEKWLIANNYITTPNDDITKETSSKEFTRIMTQLDRIFSFYENESTNFFLKRNYCHFYIE